MDSVVITGLMTVSGGVITYVLGHMAGRKLMKVDIKKRSEEAQKIAEETETIRIKNLKDTIEIYRIVHDELSQQLKEVSKKCHDLSLEIHELRTENISLKEEIQSLNKKLNEKNKI